MESCVYSVTNKANGKRYVGSTYRYGARVKAHMKRLSENCHHSVALQRAWNKYGQESFSFDVLLYCDRKNLIFYEQRAIDVFRSCREGYNILPTAGSRAGAKDRPEVVAKRTAAIMAAWARKTAAEKDAIAAKRRGIPRTPATRAAISKATTGRKLSEQHRLLFSAMRKGVSVIRKKPFSAEECAARSAAAIRRVANGYVVSEETRKKLSIAGTGRPCTPETREKIAASKRGKPCPQSVKDAVGRANKGRVVPLEERQRMAERMRQYWAKRRAAAL